MLARSGRMEYDRVLFFSDAIFAIAITLLVIDIRVPGVVFLLSIPVAFLSAQLATYFWILVAVLGITLDRFTRPAEEHKEEGEIADPAG